MPAQVIDLTNLAANEGFVVRGNVSGDRTGFGVANAGDINGDGIDDFIVGAPLGDGGGVDAGDAYVIYGRTGSTRPNIDLMNLAAADGFRIQGDVVGDTFGIRVSSAGDVNNDGIDDLLVGAIQGDNGGANAGEAYVIYGQNGATRGTLDITTLTVSEGYIIQGAAGSLTGLGLSAAGDVNEDGIDDIVVGASGRGYVVYGITGNRALTFDLTTITPADGYILDGIRGTGVSGGGDFNDDGINDIIVGAPLADNGGSNSGEAYVVYGQAGTIRTTLNLAVLALGDGFVIQGEAANDQAGYSVSNVGDINGDGIDDILLAAPANQSGGVGAGAAYVVYGVSGPRGLLDLTNLTIGDGFKIQGAAGGDMLGFATSLAGDINGDGIGDLIVSAPTGDSGGAGSGQAYVIFGQQGANRSQINLDQLELRDGLVIQGDAAGDAAGRHVSGGGDINGDGIDDLIVGATYSDVGAVDGGAVYIIYGNSSFGAIIGTAGVDTLTGTAGNDVINSLAGNDVLIGGGGEDTLNGGTGNDIYVVDSAGDVVSEAVGEGIDGVETDLSSYTLPANVETLEYTGTGIFTGTGNDLGNTIVGGGMADTLSGGLGDDLLAGESGNDSLVGGDGSDVLIGGTGADMMDGGAGNDRIVVDNAGDVATGGDGIDTLQITTAGLLYTVGVDIEIISNLSGGDVNVTLNALANTYGGSNAGELVNAGDGQDSVYGRGGDDRLRGDGGNDYLFGEAGDDILTGGNGVDFLYGGANTDLLMGDAGNDTLYGEAGVDTLSGGTGIDVLNGGAGGDIFQFSDGDTGSTIATADRITDFAQGQGDVIDLSQIDAIRGDSNALFAFIGSGAFTNVEGQLRYAVSGGNTFVQGDTDGDGVADFIIRVDGLHVLTVADFML